MLYFAYGSNMLRARIGERAPSAVAVGRAALSGFALRWHKRGRDGSGKCDIVAADEGDAVVWGVLYRISTKDRAGLDRAEGLGRGYRDAVVAVDRGGASAEALTYLAQPAYIDRRISPFGWYKALVVAGAREHGLPRGYVAALRAQRCVADEDTRRAARAWALLGGSAGG